MDFSLTDDQQSLYDFGMVPTDAPGLRRDLEDTEVPMPERQCALTFDDVRVGREDIVGRPGAALRSLRHAAGEAGYEATDAALQAFGGLGYTRGSGIVDLQRVARLLRSAPVNAESALNAVGEAALGMPRSY